MKGETTKARIRRAAHVLGWPYSRTRDLWHGDAHRIDAYEMDALRKFSPPKASENSDSH